MYLRSIILVGLLTLPLAGCLHRPTPSGLTVAYQDTDGIVKYQSLEDYYRKHNITMPTHATEFHDFGPVDNDPMPAPEPGKGWY